MSEYIVVLSDGETYDGVVGCVIYKVTDPEAFSNLEWTDRAVRDGIEKGYLVHGTDLESITNTPDLLDCES